MALICHNPKILWCQLSLLCVRMCALRRGCTTKFSCLPEHGNIERRHAVGFDVVNLESVATVDVTHLVDVRLAALDHDVKEATNGRH